MTRRSLTITCPVHANAKRDPDGIALCDARRSVTYRELEERIVRAAVRLRSLGVEENDRIAILGANSVDYAVSIFTLYRMGAVAVPLSLRHHPDRWARSIRTAKCKLILVDGERNDSAKALWLPSSIIGEHENAEGVAPHPEIASTTISHHVRTDAEATVVFTSGSTGKPRGVILTFNNHYRNALGSNRNLPLKPGNLWLAVLPFYHVGGMAILFRSAIAGSSVFIAGKFDPREINRVIDEREITHISLVPTMLEDLISTRTDRPFPANLKAILLGGGPVPDKLLEKIAAHSLPVLTTYGMTETASQIATLSPGDPAEKLRSSGRPLVHVEVRVIDASGSQVDRAREGEIAVRGETLFKGYLGGKREKTFDSRGWFHTGDIGRLDEDGYLYIRGRRDDMFVSGGENIHPAIIETAAMAFPGITECAVVATEDEKWGYRPILFIRIGMEFFPGADALQAYLEERLDPIMVPDAIIEVDELPRTGIDKIDREGLQAIYKERSSR